MSDFNNEPVSVTGYDERRHPALRKLSRACIELARQRLERQKDGEPEEAPSTAASPEQEMDRG